MESMNQFMTGAIAMAMAVAAMVFCKFWRETQDRLFALFGASFLVLAINRAAFAFAHSQDVRSNYFYWIRFVAFVIILLAILDKNRSQKTKVPESQAPA